MKLNQLVQLGIVSSVACVLSVAAGTTGALSNPSAEASSSVTPVESSTLVAENQSTIAASGTFVAAEKPTTGTARIVMENGQRYLVLDSAFNTSSQGPDLHVVLDPTDKPPMQYQDLTSYVNLGKLQKFSGEQRYPIPASVNLSDFKSVAIWCRMANATFGYAPLRSASNANRR